LQAILDTIRSKRTYIVLYYDRYEGTRRIGFWHPRIQIFVAWKPGRNSQFKTAFDKKAGLEYMRELPGCKLLYRPKEQKMRVNVEGFLRELKNYEYGVKHIIPSVFTSLDNVDSAFTDELENILYARTYLERELRLHPESKELVPHIAQLTDLDSIFRSKRDVVLQIVPDFGRGRRLLRKMPPKSHWWWYLDFLEEYETVQEVIPLAPERLGLILDEVVAARMGLRPGQTLRVRMPDSEHLLISVQ
jgi:hypothetical protein